MEKGHKKGPQKKYEKERKNQVEISSTKKKI